MAIEYLGLSSVEGWLCWKEFRTHSMMKSWNL